MKKVRARNAILRTLKEHPDGLTAEGICYNADHRYVISPKHVSNLIRGMKGIKKMEYKEKIGHDIQSYRVNVYCYDDEGAEI